MFFLPRQIQVLLLKDKLPVNSGPDKNSVNNNSPPSARDDRIRTEQNKPVLFAVLANDKDLDGDKIKIISVSSPKNGGTVMINENDTITFMPERDFVGVDTFSYVIADSEGKTDEGKVSADVRGVTDANSRTCLGSQVHQRH